MSQLEVRMEELREWLHKIETKLKLPIPLEKGTKEEMDEKMKEHEVGFCSFPCINMGF
jgi:uncharacterized HAD superfamily protein